MNILTTATMKIFAGNSMLIGIREAVTLVTNILRLQAMINFKKMDDKILCL